MTSCGSGPEGTRPTTCSVAGFTIAKVRSPLESTNSAGEGVSAPFSRACPTQERSRANASLFVIVTLAALIQEFASLWLFYEVFDGAALLPIAKPLPRVAPGAPRHSARAVGRISQKELYGAEHHLAGIGGRGAVFWLDRWHPEEC